MTTTKDADALAAYADARDLFLYARDHAQCAIGCDANVTREAFRAAYAALVALRQARAAVVRT